VLPPAGYETTERGVTRQGINLRLRAATNPAAGTFYTTGMEYSPSSAPGTGWEPTPWHATQRALKRMENCLGVTARGDQHQVE